MKKLCLPKRTILASCIALTLAISSTAAFSKQDDDKDKPPVTAEAKVLIQLAGALN